jgi:hypothetical protein
MEYQVSIGGGEIVTKKQYRAMVYINFRRIVSAQGKYGLSWYIDGPTGEQVTSTVKSLLRREYAVVKGSRYVILTPAGRLAMTRYKEKADRKKYGGRWQE